jgi:1-deoxy-D-xylulose-5-phosphate reductoisomerase
MRRISVFGATGSIGENTLDLLTPGSVQVVALTGGRQVDRLAAQARRFDADIAVTAHPECYACAAGRHRQVPPGPERPGQ